MAGPLFPLLKACVVGMGCIFLGDVPPIAKGVPDQAACEDRIHGLFTQLPAYFDAAGVDTKGKVLEVYYWCLDEEKAKTIQPQLKEKGGIDLDPSKPKPKGEDI